MSRRIAVSGALALFAVAAFVGGMILNRPPHAYVEADPADFPRLRFEDGAISSNDRCPVKRNKLNRALDPLYVNGRPVGFC